MSTEYVAGFLVTEGRVLLICKKRPDYLRGYWNPPGGKIEAGEAPLDAMVREFTEETGLGERNVWRKFAELDGGTDLTGGFRIHLFLARVCCFTCYSPKQLTDEELRIFLVSDVLHDMVRCLPNVRWLLQMGLSVHGGAERARYFIIRERYEEPPV